jgi:hypothetical protein
VLRVSLFANLSPPIVRFRQIEGDLIDDAAGTHGVERLCMVVLRHRMIKKVLIAEYAIAA